MTTFTKQKLCLNQSNIDLEPPKCDNNTADGAELNRGQNHDIVNLHNNRKKYNTVATDGAVSSLDNDRIDGAVQNPSYNNLYYPNSNKRKQNTRDEKSQQTASLTMKNEVKPELHILGGQQFAGLASQLIHSRANSNYEKYRISSTIKSQASSEEILKSSCELTDSSDNYIIVCVGENDTNPNKIVIELVSLLKNMQKTNVVVFNVLHNKYLNTNMINNSIQLICKNFKNCSFVKVDSYNSNKYYYFMELCRKINYVIDSKFYSRVFLTGRNKFVNNNDKTEYKTVPRRGTIPYYFKPISRTTNQYDNNAITQQFFRSN
ncbi:hypothetical protein HF086_008310 [Spodoptera exigua]|uniref:Uncharacterized protein n=1 Tax=Spodoptera exigua TaxID=7107 RepID=A0A922M3B6_SPOEX|nr:hypothetical protein HF086_008310 [Spodoptera exigua]